MISITQMVINWEILQLSKHNSQELYLITRSFDNKGNYKKCFVDTVRSKKIDGGGGTLYTMWYQTCDILKPYGQLWKNSINTKLICNIVNEIKPKNQKIKDENEKLKSLEEDGNKWTSLLSFKIRQKYSSLSHT